MRVRTGIVNINILKINIEYFKSKYALTNLRVYTGIDIFL